LPKTNSTLSKPCTIFDITPVTLKKSQENWPLVTVGQRARQWLMAVYLSEIEKRLRQWGRYVAQYSSVSSAVERVRKKRQDDNRFKKRLKEVIESIKKGQT